MCCVLSCRGSGDGVVVRALTSNQCDPRFLDLVISCASSLLLVPFSAPRGFYPGTLVFLSPKNQHL